MLFATCPFVKNRDLNINHVNASLHIYTDTHTRCIDPVGQRPLIRITRSPCYIKSEKEKDGGPSIEKKKTPNGVSRQDDDEHHNP